MKTLIMLMAVVLVGCTAPPQKKGEHHMVFFKDYKSVPDNELSFWIAYNLVLGGCINEKEASYDIYPLSCESEAREAMVKVLSENDTPQYYLDLAKVKNNGYIEEYAFYYHVQDQWIISDPQKYEAFKKWRAIELDGHKPQTRIIGMMDNHISKNATGH